MTRAIVATTLMLSGAVLPGAAATLRSETLAAWNEYVAATERKFAADASISPAASAGGRNIDIPGGTIQHWRGTILVPGITRDALLSRLMNPSEPYQEDVLALTVLARRPDGLDLFIRMTHRALITVTYDTEHRVTFRRHGATRASSRSVSTRVDEVGREDRGLLWRVNAYWRYEQVPEGVLVDLESLTLSRAIPFGLGPIVKPLVHRVARESVTRTLEHLRRAHGAGDSAEK